MTGKLQEAEKLLKQAQSSSEMAEARHNTIKEAFEQRECGLETYLAALRDLMLAKAEVTVAEFRVTMLRPPASDGHVTDAPEDK